MRELSAKLTEGETPARPFLSLRQKSKIFATSLVRGRLWGCAAGVFAGQKRTRLRAMRAFLNR